MHRCPHTHITRVLYNRRMKQFGIFLALFALLSSGTAYAAADFSATPVVIDGKGKQREILRYTINLENTSNHLISLYPWVTDLEPSDGTLAKGDLGGTKGKEIKDSLARWIEVTRGAQDLLPGDKREIPVVLQINLNAPPGMYHAIIHFSEGNDRSSAEANKANTADVMMNIEVEDDANERLQLGVFTPASGFFGGDKATFDYRIENIGNRDIIPMGHIRIFDRKGEEIGTVDANADGKKVEPEGKLQLASVWASGEHIGRYKAMLDVSYGSSGTIQDTVYFWVLPWGRLLSYFFSLAIFLVIIALFIHSYLATRGTTLAFAPATQVDVEEDDETDEETGLMSWRERFQSLLARIPKPRLPFAFGNDVEEETLPSEPLTIHRATEVRIPPPERTRLMMPSTTLTPASTTRPQVSASVVLSAKAKPQVDPAHVVTLRSKNS